DNGQGNEIIKNYTYDLPAFPGKTSGGILHLPVYAYPGVKAEGVLPEQGLMNPDYYSKILIRFGANQAMLGDSESGRVGYRYVTEYSSGNGKTIYHYSFPGAYGESHDDPARGCSFEMQGLCDNLFKQHTVMRSVSSAVNPVNNSGIELLSNQPNTYPFGPHTNYDFNRGLLLEQTFFKQSGEKIRAINNQYALLYANEKEIETTQTEEAYMEVCCSNTANLFRVWKWSDRELLLNIG
ncbi:MAG: hypothetical protein ACKO96_02535, partial [Flammeovirgaceae bacterium]